MPNAAATVKHLYAALFDWLLRKLNSEHGRGLEGVGEDAPFVGILDIFGFEVLRRKVECYGWSDGVPQTDEDFRQIIAYMRASHDGSRNKKLLPPAYKARRRHDEDYAPEQDNEQRERRDA